MSTKNSVASYFDIHRNQLLGKEKEAHHQLNTIVVDSSTSITDWALWLWVVTEQIVRFEQSSFLTQTYQTTIEKGIKVLQEEWEQPHENIFGNGTEEVHTSSLSMIYAALLGVKNTIGRTDLQQTITSIRDSIFNNHLSGGMLIRARKVKEVSTDQLFAVMPFGLFSPEDLVMVEAVKEMEERFVTVEGVYPYRGASKPSAITAMMLSWYFYEKGDSYKARMYYELAEKTNHDRNQLYWNLKEIVSFYMEEQLVQNDLSIVHKPYGHDNPYDPQVFERHPRDPEINQYVYVACQLLGANPNEEVEMNVFIDDGTNIFSKSCLKEKKQNDIVWQANLGQWSSKKTISYWFEAKTSSHVVKSDTFKFSLYERIGLEMIDEIAQDDTYVWIKGKATNKNIYLFFEKEGGAFGVSLDEPNLSFSVLSVEEMINLDETALYIQPHPLHISIKKGDETILQSYDDAIFPFVEWLENENGFIHRVEWNFHSPLHERFFGLGERYHQLEYRGDEIDCYVFNQYRDQGSKTYMPVPFYVSSNGYGLFLKTDQYSVFDFAHHFSDRLQIRCDVNSEGLHQTFQLFTGNPKDVVSQFTLETGKAKLPPVWAFGPWMSSNNWDRDSIVRKQVQLTNEYKIPSTVLVIEQWSDEATYYIFNDAEYEMKPGKLAHKYDDYHFPEWGRWPNPKGLIDYLHDQGLKVILWQIPIHKYLNRQHHPQKDADEAFMIEQGYCVKDENGNPFRLPEGWFKESLLMDFTNREANKWWFEKRQYLLDIGVDGFKTDGGEFVFGQKTQFYDGSTGHVMRNRYPNDYIEAYYQFATNYHNGEALTFSRAGYTGAQNFPAHWAGDERSTFDAFRNSLIAGLSTGMSGIPMWGWDLAGFNGDIPTAELFIRSAQMAAFCPIMQYHAESKAEFNQDRTPWNIADRTGDNRAISGYRYYANVRMNLLPYIYEQARKSTENGIPLMKSLFMEYPSDEKVFTIYDQYFFGEDLLVAPVIEEGAEERDVYFPEGEWIHLFTNEIISGPSYKRVKSTLMEIPVYVKKGSAVITNCDETLSLGSWVGNEVNRYHTPVLRIYPEEGMDQVVKDHLGNEWNIKATNNHGSINIIIGGLDGTNVLIPKNMIEENHLVTVNGTISTVNESGLLTFNL